MAEPKLQIDKRIEKLFNDQARTDLRMQRIENAVGTMAQWLVQAQTGFNAKDAEGIEKILRGEKDNASEEPEAESLGVREQGDSLGEEASLRQQGETPEAEEE